MCGSRTVRGCPCVVCFLTSKHNLDLSLAFTATIGLLCLLLQPQQSLQPVFQPRHQHNRQLTHQLVRQQPVLRVALKLRLNPLATRSSAQAPVTKETCNNVDPSLTSANVHNFVTTHYVVIRLPSSIRKRTPPPPPPTPALAVM
jgi:hypothetical protein